MVIVQKQKPFFEFLGCYFHKCCKCTKLSDRAIENKNNKTKYDTTMARLKYIESLNYNVKIILECDYRKLVLQEIEDKSLPKFYQNNKGTVTTNQILDAVLNDNIFAAIEVDNSNSNSNSNCFIGFNIYIVFPMFTITNLTMTYKHKQNITFG